MKIELAKRAEAAPFYFCWISPQNLQWTMFIPGRLAGRINGLKHLVACEDFRPHLDEQLIFIRSEKEKLDEVIGVYASVPSIANSWKVHIWKNGRSQSLPLTLCDDLPSQQWLDALYRVAATKPEFFSGSSSAGEIVIGSQAVCLLEEDSLSLIRIGRGEPGGMSGTRRISRKAVVEWEHANRRHLPRDWKDPAVRKGLWDNGLAKDLALAACRDWSRTRKQDQWQANPLGLLWALPEGIRPTK